MDGAFGIVQERIEVELLLRGRDIELYILLAVDTSEAGCCIESARAASIVEPHLLDFRRDALVRQHKPAESRDTVEGDLVVDRLFRYRDVRATDVRVAITLGVGELDARGIGHRGVAPATMTYHYQQIITFLELESGCSEIGIIARLINLLDARTI